MSGNEGNSSRKPGPGDRFRIAGWEVDVRALSLTREAETRHLEAKVMELLVCLAARPGETLTREELEQKLWPGGVISYHSLTTAVIKLRRAFGDSAKDPFVVETVPKIGYRLIAEVESNARNDIARGSFAAAGARNGDAPAEGSTSAGGTLRPRRRLSASIAALVLALTAAGLAWWWQAPAPETEPARLTEMAHSLPDKPSLAVLPFENLSEDPRQEYFVDGMTEDLITDLSRVSGLFVVASHSVFTYKGKPITVRQVAEDLGVRYVLEGSVRRDGERVRINAQLIDALTGIHVWAERYDGVMDDMFALQDEFTRRIVTQLAGNLDQGATGSRRTLSVDPRAYDLFLRGWGYFRSGSVEDYAMAIPLFEAAIAADPEFGRARAALAALFWSLLRKGWWREQRLELHYYEAFERARILLKETMRLPTAVSYQIASEWAAYFKRKPDEALALAEAAIALDPNNPAGYLARANAMLHDGQPQEAERSVRTAMRLDPLHPPDYLVRLAQSQFQSGAYRSAAETLESAAALMPDNDWIFVYLAAAFGQLNFADRASEALARANRLRAKSGWGPLTIVTTSHKRFRWPGDIRPLQAGLRNAGAAPGGEWFSRVDRRSDPPAVEGVSTINAERAKALHERGAVFIDAHRAWFSRHIPGAHFLEYWEEGWLFNTVSLRRITGEDEEIVIYAQNPNDAAEASALAASRGFDRIHYFPGGLDAWRAAGYPVEEPRQRPGRDTASGVTQPLLLQEPLRLR